MKPLRVHVIYEHGEDLRPYSSSHIRLLRPLSHPGVAPWVEMSSGPELTDEPVDLVVVDRLWHDEVSALQAEALLDEVRRRRARFLYSLDDNLLALLETANDDASAARQLAALRIFLQGADRVLVSTWPLHDRIREINSRVTVIPNYLDERLLPWPALGTPEEHKRRLASKRQRLEAPVTLGYMGTRTHDGDLRVIAPALRNVCRRHSGRLRVQFVGAIARSDTWAILSGVPLDVLDPGLVHTEYPSFLPWFAATCRWDVALAPLDDTPFNRYKSDMKFLDYAALGAAGVFSRVLPYIGTVRDGITGSIVDNNPDAWENAIEHLISHPVEAVSIGWSAQNHLRQHRTLAQGSSLWLNVLRLTMTQSA